MRKNSGKKVAFKGEMLTIGQITALSEVSRMTIIRRIKRGLADDDLIAKVSSISKVEPSTVINGASISLSDLSDSTGVCINTIRNRLESGDTGVDLIRPSRTKTEAKKQLISKIKSLINDGVRAICVADECGVSLSTVYNVKQGKLK